MVMNNAIETGPMVQFYKQYNTSSQASITSSFLPPVKSVRPINRSLLLFMNYNFLYW